MKGRHFALRTSLTGLAWIWLLASGPAWGQIPTEIKRADDPTPHRQTIDQFVRQQVTRLAEAQDPAQQSQARTALIENAHAGRDRASPAYLDVYADAVNNHIMRIPADAPMRVRLNAAIVVEGVARHADNRRLMEAAIRFINDNNKAVALWGMRSGRWLLPHAMRPPQNQNLLPAMVRAAKANDWDLIVEEAYQAMLHLVTDAQPPVGQQVIQTVLPGVMELLDHRIQIYVTRLPEAPQVENAATLFVSLPRVWAAQGPPQRVETMEALCHLISLGGQHVVRVGGDQRGQLILMISRTAGAVESAAHAMNNEALATAAGSARDINVRMSGQEIQQRTQAVCDAIRQVPDFAQISAPPEIRAAAAGN